MHKCALPNEKQTITKQPFLKFMMLIYNGSNKMQGNGKLPYRVSGQPERRFMAYTCKSIWGLMSTGLHCESIRSTLKRSINFWWKYAWRIKRVCPKVVVLGTLRLYLFSYPDRQIHFFRSASLLSWGLSVVFVVSVPSRRNLGEENFENMTWRVRIGRTPWASFTLQPELSQREPNRIGPPE